MRIGIDMLGVQSPHHGHRGIGRYGLHLVRALLGRDDGHEYLLYAHAGLPLERVPDSPRGSVRLLGEGGGRAADGLTVSQRLERLARRNPDRLDALLLLSPFEYWGDYHPPGRAPGGPRLVSVVHDLAPFLEAGEDGCDPVLMRYYRVLEDLRRYDALLAVSEATRRDCLRLLALPDDRVTALDEEPDPSSPDSRWAEIARGVTDVLEGLPRRHAPAPRRPPARPRIAFFSPFPPRKSGVSDYSVLLLRELKQAYSIDLYHDSGYVPEPSLAGEFECCDARLFPRRAAMRDYRGVVYQMGNSRFHRFLYETMLRHPGVVTLHDFCLAGFHLMYGHHLGIERPFIREELLRWYPDRSAEIARVLDGGDWDREVIARECGERGWYLNRRVLASAQRVVVHSPWCLEQVRKASPDDAERVTVIPHGIWPRDASDDERAAIRARFAIPREALMIASFGFVHPDKMSPEALDAFRSVARADPSAVFVFAGEEADGGAVSRHAEALGLSGRVRFLGRQSLPDFTDLIAASDVGVNLRRPPTHGETSGALLYLLASGVATIVTDVATFTDYPGSAVWKVRWEKDGLAGLEHALRTLATDRTAREALGRAARDYVREHHVWSRVAESYIDVIERCHAERGVRVDTSVA